MRQCSDSNLSWEKLGQGTLSIVYNKPRDKNYFQTVFPKWASSAQVEDWFSNSDPVGQNRKDLQFTCTDGMSLEINGFCAGNDYPRELGVTKVLFNDDQLIDGYYAEGDVMQVVNNSIVMRSTNGNFQIGDYVRTTDIAYASWLAIKNGYSVSELKESNAQAS